MDVNPKEYEVTEHIPKKFEIKPCMLSTLNNARYIYRMNPVENFETSMVGPLGILVDLVNRKIDQGYSKSGFFFWENPHESSSGHLF